MAAHKWASLPTRHFGPVWSPIVELSVHGRDCSRRLAFLVDTGAVVSLLRRSVAQFLGVELEAGRRIELGAIGGGKTIAFVHEVRVSLESNDTRTIFMGIANTERVPNLLGRFSVLDQVGVDLDASLQETRFNAPWLPPNGRALIEFFSELDAHILARWDQVNLSNDAKLVIARFLQRAQQLVSGLVQHDRCHRYDLAQSLIRPLFELSAQLEFLLRDPEPRARKFVDFEVVTKYRLQRSLLGNPTGPVSSRVAMPPLRAAGEARLEADFRRVEPQFRRNPADSRKHWPNWYCMTVKSLCEQIGWTREYEVMYALWSGWTHFDPAHLSDWPNQRFTGPTIGMGFYARMLRRLADDFGLILSAEQYDFLKSLQEPIS